MSNKSEKLATVYPDGESFEINGRIILDPSWKKAGELVASDEMVIEFPPETE